ncbi:MAG TPA: enoyl-CoA hydratase/isomerase family protein [Methylomirabilota bacterium]|jgi:enoyl-CoA hydratase|nr:enoyl-CoA hydratase/isomerase family protein [Methylomirabilota bacterium]
MPNHFILEKDGRIATLTFNRPEKRNPLNEEIILEFENLLHEVRDDKDVRVLIFTGTGNTFSAGADLSQVKGVTDKEERQRIFAPLGKRRARLIGRAINVLVNLEQVTIAAVNGYAAGGGWTLALGCDFRIAVEEAEFWFPEVDLGVPLSPASTALVVAHVGPTVAKEIIISCRRYKAAELLPLGLVSQVVKKEELLPAARRFAESLANKNPTAVMASKATINALAFGNSVVRPDLLLARE